MTPETRSFKELHDSVVAHYTKLKFYKHARLMTQKCYALTEAGETTKAVLVNDIPEIQDGIGDILVCIINWSQLAFVDIKQLTKRRPPSFFFTGVPNIEPDKLCVIIHERICRLEKRDLKNLHMLVHYLERLAKKYSLTLNDCLGCAHDVVVNRRVKPLNGTVVKEANWHKHPELENVEPL